MYMETHHSKAIADFLPKYTCKVVSLVSLNQIAERGSDPATPILRTWPRKSWYYLPVA